MTQINAAKVTAYAAELAVPAVAVGKVAAYAAELPIVKLELQKLTAYAFESIDSSGDAYQTDTLLRPVYRAGPKPYVEFTAGSSLDVSVIYPGLYTLILLKPDGSSVVRNLTLSAGAYTLAGANFNQAVLAFGGLSRVAVAAVIYSMRVRAGF